MAPIWASVKTWVRVTSGEAAVAPGEGGGAAAGEEAATWAADWPGIVEIRKAVAMAAIRVQPHRRPDSKFVI
ncbi:hypothetical protein HpMS107_36170 [Helicobacter pylori]